MQRDGLTIVFRNVPAQVCRNCGEASVEEATSGDILRRGEAAARAGVVVDVQEYRAEMA